MAKKSWLKGKAQSRDNQNPESTVAFEVSKSEEGGRNITV